MIKDLLTQNQFVFKKKYGQNFITDTNLLKNIIELSEIPEGEEILEIGAGAGTLTKQLADKFKRVIAYEIDITLKPVLESFLADEKNVKLVFADALKEILQNIESDFSGGYSVIANLPYYITTPLIFKFLASKRVNCIYVMVQKEVGERLAAKKGDSEYGSLSVVIDAIANVKITKAISRHMFFPPPNVDSCMIKIQLDRKKYKIDDYDAFCRLVQASFAMRRKTLLNNLSAAYKLTKEHVKDILIKQGFNENVRGEELSAADYIKLLTVIK